MGFLLVTLTAAAPAKPKSPTIDLKPAMHEFVHIAIVFWPLWLILGAAAAAKLAFAVWDERRLARSGIGDVDVMDGKTFEEFLATRYRRLGYDVDVTKYQGDFGADLVITKEGVRTAVQAKRWNRPVGLDAVQQVVAAKAYYRCQLAAVVSNQPFTQQARELAAVNDVKLWDRDVLVAKLLETAPDPIVRTATDEAAVCASCGAPLSDKVRDYCVAHSSRFGGRLYCYKHQRARHAIAGGFAETR